MMDDPHAATDTVEAGTPLDETRTVTVLLHGRGAEAASITPLADDIPGVTVLAPQARQRTWYPERFTAPREDNQPWLDSALTQVQTVVERATDHVPRERVVLAGFSQGACLALEYAASNPARYHSVWGFSGGMIGKTLPGYEGDMDGTPLHLVCADHDPHIPVERVRETAAVFRALNADVETRIREGKDHRIPEEERERFRRALSEET